MGVPVALINDLTTFGDALDDPTSHLPRACDMLAESFASAVPAFLGLTVMVHFGDNPVVVTSIDPCRRSAVCASLQLTLLPMGTATTSGSVSFYGGRPGMFVDLADDVRWILNLDGRPVLDNQLPSVDIPRTSRPAEAHATRVWRCRRTIHLPRPRTHRG